MSKEIEDRIVWGFYVEDTQKFYYLENGLSRPSASVDRLRRLLLARNIITLIGPPTHRLITYAEAKSKGYDIEPVFTSEHIKRQWLAEQEQKQQAGKRWR